MKRNIYKILRKPLITEKSMDTRERTRTITFQVDVNATKPEIKAAVQTLFKIKVEAVRTANFPGKLRRRGRYSGYRPDWKKAYVKIKAGEKMPEFGESA